MEKRRGRRADSVSGLQLLDAHCVVVLLPSAHMLQLQNTLVVTLACRG